MRNFESEYREMIRKETPDLWGRIEAELSDKNGETVKIAESVKATETKKKEEGREDFRMGKFFKYSGMAAACLCGIIIIPVVLRLVSGGTNEKMWTTEESTYTAETAEDLEMESGGLLTEATQTDLDKNIQMEDTTVCEEGMEDGTVIENVKVRILEITEMKYHTIYLAVVEKDESGMFHTGEEVEFIAEDTLQNALQEGESCLVTLTYDAHSEIAYHLTALVSE